MADLAAPLAGPRTIVSPANATIVDIAAGRMPLGATVAQVVQAVRREREAGWSGAHRVNMHNMLDFVEQVLVYTEPFEDDTDADLPDVAAWMRARLALPGVEVGGSVHVALLLAPDLARAIAFRAQTDRRTERLNDQAAARHHKEWVRYEAALARRATRNYGGRAPKRPADLVLRSPQVPVNARTEELFATGLGMVLRYAAAAHSRMWVLHILETEDERIPGGGAVRRMTSSVSDIAQAYGAVTLVLSEALDLWETRGRRQTPPLLLVPRPNPWPPPRCRGRD